MTAVTGQTSGIVIEAERSRSYAEPLGLTAGIRRGVMVALRCVLRQRESVAVSAMGAWQQTGRLQGCWQDGLSEWDLIVE